ncbi:unnamed protein product [Peniophora sp. CBMAI 1063]|nr:unnamed protein product [Peniophora sp. CBMAI 1063]
MSNTTFEPGSAAFRFTRTNRPGFVILYYGAIAHRSVNRRASPAPLHPNPIKNLDLLLTADVNRTQLAELYLSAYVNTLPEGIHSEALVDTYKDYMETSIGLMLWSRTLYVFGRTEEERNERLALAQGSIDSAGARAGQLDAVVQILRLGRDDPQCPGLTHMTII